MTRSKLLFVLLFCAFFGNAFAQECPKIYHSGDTLKTDPAGGYQWFLNGSPISNATKQWHLGTVKGDYSVEVSGSSPAFAVNNQAKNIFGRIIDERYEPLADAKITVAGKTISSDAQGLFSLKDVDIKGTTAVLTIEKAGFWKNTQRITFFDGKEANLTAMLEPLRVTNRFDATKGTTISERGFFLTFPPNSAVKEDGSLYTGTINLSLKRAFPSEEGFGYRMPGGDFSAIDANGQEKILISYGFMSAEMQGSKGEKLNLAKDKEATLEFYIPWEQNKTAPESIPLWHFDEISGMWFPEGTARKVGPRYMGTVKHFSSWNCDYPTGRATVKGRVLNCKKQPPSIRIPVIVGQRVVTINAEGYYTSFVPSETTFNVTARVDTVNVTQPLTEGEERTVKDLEANTIIDAVGLIDSTGTLTVYGYGVKEYSVDGGTTFQIKSQKLTFTENYPIKGIARDAAGCEVKFKVFIRPKQGDCQVLDSATLSRKQIFSGIVWALSATETVYKLDLGSGVFGSVEMLSVFPCLQYLNLNSIGLMNVPESIGQLTNLQTLYLNENDLMNIPEFIGQFTNLQTLSLFWNQLTSLPESFGQLTKLQKLDIGNNPLTNLPESFEQLSNLQYLGLYNVDLTTIPASIIQLTNLRELSLTSSQLMSIPESIGQLTNLQSLVLSSGVGFGTLPNSIGQLTNLQTLDLRYNRLSSLPSTLATLKDNLKNLILTGNTISPEERAKIESWLPNTNITW